MAETESISSADALGEVWAGAGLNATALQHVTLPEDPQCLPSSFRVGTAAQASIGAAALAAEQIYHLRCGRHQAVRVSKAAAELECTGYFQLDGTNPSLWEKFSGLYEARDGYVRIHANFDHHRDGVLKLLSLADADHAEPGDVAAALSGWSAEDFETAAAGQGLVVAMVRTFDAWDAHPHAIATRHLPLISIRKIADAPTERLTAITPGERPLTGLRVLDLTRILAGPICGRTLAAYGADVMLINSPTLPNIASIIDTSRGKRSVQLDLKRPADVLSFNRLLENAHIFVQGYRPGSLAALGLSPGALARQRPGIICVSLSAYGTQGRGPNGAASTLWCRPPPDSIMRKRRLPEPTRPGRCPFRSSTTHPVFLWPSVPRQPC